MSSDRINEIDRLLEEALAARVNDMDRAFVLVQKALEQCQEIDYGIGIARAKSHLALFYMIRTEFDQARAHCEEALELSRSMNDRIGEADALYTQGSIYYKSDDFYKGLSKLNECKEICKQLKDHFRWARTLKAMGTVYEFFNDDENAFMCYQECLELSRQCGDRMIESNVANPLSGIYLKQGELEKADELANLSIRLKKETGDTRGLSYALYTKGKTMTVLGKAAEAVKYFNEALAVFRKVGDRIGASMTLNKLGHFYRNNGQLEIAREHLLDGLQMASYVQHNQMLHKINLELYKVSKAMGDNEGALSFLEAQGHFREIAIKSETQARVKSLKMASKLEMLERETRLQKEKNLAIENKNSELDNLIYRLSHDIRGPITSLLGLKGLVDLDISEPVAVKYFDLYHQQIQRLNSIVLELIRLHNVKGTELTYNLIDFESEVQQIIDGFRYLHDFSRVDFILEIDKDLEFHSDRLLIISILQNLIENGIKYTKTEGRNCISFRVMKKPAGDCLLIQVSDQGLGIQKKFQQNVFDLFFRATANRKIEGTGLGLYIVKSAVEKLDGTVSLNSKKNEGSTFNIELPYPTKEQLQAKSASKKSN